MPTRYFIGLPLPKQANQDITELQTGWPIDHWAVHFRTNVEPHITLKAPFNSNDSSWIEATRQLVEHSPAPRIRLGRTDFFTAKVIHLTIDSPELIRLQQELIRLFPPNLRTTRENGPYIPHLTLAIANSRMSQDSQSLVAHWIKQRLIIPSFLADRLHIYKRQEGDQESYEVADEIRFWG